MGKSSAVRLLVDQLISQLAELRRYAPSVRYRGSIFGGAL